MKTKHKNLRTKNVGITKEMLNFEPILYERDVSYNRNEKKGFKSIAFNSPINHTPILFSKLDAEFMELCNGTYRVIDIVTIISINNIDVPWIICISNSINLLNYLTELRVLYGNKNNPFLNRKIIKFDNDTELIELSYMDYNKTQNFIDKAFLLSKKNYFYMNPIKNRDILNHESFLKQIKSIENNSFFIKWNSKSVGLLIFEKSKFENEYILNGIICNNDFQELIKLTNLYRLFLCDYLRIKVYTEIIEDQASKFFEGNFQQKFMLRNELNIGLSVYETDIYYIKNEIGCE